MAAALLGCGGTLPDVPTIERVAMHFIARPDADGRWFVQSDVDHEPIGGTPSAEQTTEYLFFHFGRLFTKAGVIQVTSDDDFGKAGVSVHCNLGLAGSRCLVMAPAAGGGRQVIDPATITRYASPGSGNLWVSVEMTSVR